MINWNAKRTELRAMSAWFLMCSNFAADKIQKKILKLNNPTSFQSSLTSKWIKFPFSAFLKRINNIFFPHAHYGDSFEYEFFVATYRCQDCASIWLKLPFRRIFVNDFIRMLSVMEQKDLTIQLAFCVSTHHTHSPVRFGDGDQ